MWLITACHISHDFQLFKDSLSNLVFFIVKSFSLLSEIIGSIFVTLIINSQGRSQPHSPGWARVPLSSFSPQISINFSSNFTHFLPHFGPPGGRVAHPGRPWLRHCKELRVFKIGNFVFKVTVHYGLWEKGPSCNPLILFMVINTPTRRHWLIWNWFIVTDAQIDFFSILLCVFEF